MPKSWKCLCCSCFKKDINCSKGADSILVVNKDEPTEYVVEKLAIKRVPLRLIEPELKKSSEKIDADKMKPKISFRTYYATTKRKRVRIASEKPLIHRRSTISLRSNSEDEEQVQVQRASENDLRELEDEQQILSKVLNTFSSLFTMDPKEAIPKDPCPVNPPKNEPGVNVFFPEHVLKRLSLQSPLRQKRIQQQPFFKESGEKVEEAYLLLSNNTF